MKRRRLELPRSNFHYPLKVARLPIPPPLQYAYNIQRTSVPRTGLEPARRETHAPETCASTNSATWALVLRQLKSLSEYQRAANETRTRDPDLGKVVLYQLSYCRILTLSPSLKGQIEVGATGFEPAAAWSQTRSATGLRYAPLHIQELLAVFLNCECKGSTFF